VKKPLVRALVIAAAVAPLVACSLFLDLEPVQFVDPPDALALDGNVPDAPVTPADAPNDVTLDASSRCSDGKRHDFCDDFEGITGEIHDRWNKRKELSGTGAIAPFVTDGAPSPVTVFRSSIDRGADGGQVVHIARISKQESPWPRTATGAQPGVRIAFEALFETLDELSHEAVFVNVVIGKSATSEHVLLLYVRDDGTSARFRVLEIYEDAEAGGVLYASKELPMAAPRGVWTPVVLEVQERAPGLNGGANITIGQETAPYYIASASRTPYFRADLGMSVGTLAGSRTTVLYDNVRIDFLP
jgi:hypothetical protein